jgi:C-terminal leucine zipper domain of cyclic nucleotide-gated channels
MFKIINFYFVKVSILNIPGNRTGNRRTANVRSVGYSDVFCLAKADLWRALEDYPEARRNLLDRGCQLLRKDGLLDEDELKKAEAENESLRDKVLRLGEFQVLITHTHSWQLSNYTFVRHQLIFVLV